MLANDSKQLRLRDGEFSGLGGKETAGEIDAQNLLVEIGSEPLEGSRFRLSLRGYLSDDIAG